MTNDLEIPADGDWRLIPEESRAGPMQMALDEVAAETVANGGPPTVRVYRWTPSTLSLGYKQAEDTVDWRSCEDAGIDIVRRPTGGGGIYHDRRADVSYSIVAPADLLPGDLLASYERLCEPILSTFARLGIDAGFAEEERPAIHPPACYLRPLNPAHDIVAPDGRKLSGNAQYRRREAVIQHGSLKYDLDVERHLLPFAASIDPDVMRDRVSCVRDWAAVDRDSMVAALEEALTAFVDATPGGWTDQELDRAAVLARDRYGSEPWTRDRSAARP